MRFKVSNHIRTCGTCGQAIGVGSDAVETIRKSAEKRVVDEIIEMLTGIILLAEECCPDDDYSRAASKIGVAMVESILEELKQKYGVSDE